MAPRGLAVLHYVWLVKSDTRIPYLYATIIGVLLLMRLLPLRKVFHAQSR
jgi:DMSO/TMAO reductase YedYZ heme-binding membrane subunit